MKLHERVAIVTGAGAGLGRSHALFLASQGARVVVNDMGASAETVTAEIVAAGGEAIAQIGSVTDEAFVPKMVDAALARWSRVDILINNAGILRDASFAKMSIADFRTVIDVHLIGAAICSKAVWEPMRAQSYGRIVMTSSSSGLFGNFGQSNYGAAKMALVGLMQTLSLEGSKYNIRVNCLAPTARTAMTENILPAPLLELYEPELVSPVLLKLVGEDAPNRAILNVGGGHLARTYVTLTGGHYVGGGPDMADKIVTHWDEIGDRAVEQVPDSGGAQVQQEVAAAMAAKASQ
ncbi:MAG: SDR family NAD(P)-dependent oxidoreductase [Hyphomonadaceae bacterium]|nr:SDR family NAD(P)-dependent oxidoreductase [Hyphomonadaceae bacterium]